MFEQALFGCRTTVAFLVLPFQAILNKYGQKRTPCLFLVDYSMHNARIFKLEDIDPRVMLYDFRGVSNCHEHRLSDVQVNLDKHPVPFTRYEKAFSLIQSELRNGNTYLVNLTAQTPITLDTSLRNVFLAASAKYRLWLRDEFVFFSPEQFVSITEATIKTFPMKGTIVDTGPDSGLAILANEKEMAEHITVVDLLRNDIGMVASQVRVERFRYIDRIVSPEGILLQVSSEISGKLPDSWREQLGAIITALLPAGSVTGAPKKKTMEIIERAEQYPRGYYTGVAGLFDGERLDSCVMIRFIERISKNEYVYKSGGGITIYSDALAEYQELNDKIYVPIA